MQHLYATHKREFLYCLLYTESMSVCMYMYVWGDGSADIVLATQTTLITSYDHSIHKLLNYRFQVEIKYP